MASAHVQTVKLDSSGTSVDFPAMTVTAGNLMTVFFRAGSSDTIGISDNLSNTWTPFPTQFTDGGGDGVAGWYAKNIIGGSCTITMTSAGGPSMRGQASEWSGLDTSSPADQQSTPVAVTNQTTITSNSITTTQDAEMLVVFAESALAVTPVDSTVGTANGTIPTNGTSSKTAIEYHHETVAGTYTGAFTGYDVTDTVNIFIVSFKDQGAMVATFDSIVSPPLARGPRILNVGY